MIHAAGIASPMVYRRYPLETMDANINGLRQLLDRARSLEQEGLLQRPSTWLAYELVVTEVEFWQSSPDRLYRRLRYDLTKFGWAAVRLQP